MFPSALVIFREVLEIVLIVGIILAATKTIPGRLKYVLVGMAAGIFGAGVVAYFIDFISNLAEGTGQEIFNAGILTLASIFIGSTIIWMKNHACETKGNFKKLGDQVASGNVSYFMLSFVIALALLREGAEIVLFTYGALASGQSVASVLTGAIIGFTMGGALGTLLYVGLVRIPMQHFFRVTTGILAFLVAGMMSQAVGYLQSAGELEWFGHVVWNSSGLISDHSIVGQTLKILLGYTSQPTLLQIIIYVLTLGVIIMALILTKKTHEPTIPSFGKVAGGPIAMIGKLSLVMGPLTLLAFINPAYAEKTVYTPYVERGEIELEYYGQYNTHGSDDEDGAWEQKIGIGYGVNDFWASELSGEFARDGEGSNEAELAAIEWENKFQLTNPGQYWLDIGALTELAINTDGGGGRAGGKIAISKRFWQAYPSS